MENTNPPVAGGSKTGMWVALVIVIVVIGVGAYFVFTRDNGTNVNNGNVIANNNSSVTANVNTESNSSLSSNTNSESNSNVASNSNESVDKTDWQTYTNTAFGYSIEIPSDWTFNEINTDQNLSGEARYVEFANSQRDRVLQLGIRKTGDNYLLTPRVLFYAAQDAGTSYSASESLSVEGITIPTTVIQSARKVKQWFLGNESNITPIVKSHEIYAEYKAQYPPSDNETYQNVVSATDMTDELVVIRAVLSSINFL